MTTPEAISQRDAATRLGISRATVERWVNQGRLNTVRTGERGGARRVLVDDAFHTAKNASRKIPHPSNGLERKSLIRRNPSSGARAEIPHTPALPETALEGESLTRSNDETPVPDLPRNGSAESLAVDSQESLTAKVTEESLTSVEAPDILDTPPATQNSRHPRRPFDADLVSLTTPHDPEPRVESHASPAISSKRPGTRATVALLLVAVAAAAALAIYHPWHQSSRADAPRAGHTSGTRGAQAGTVRTTGQANAVAPSVTRPRGGQARPIGRPTAAPAKGHTSTTPTRSPGQPATQPTTTRPHRQHPITPCQSTGICVPD
jgi:excisionase family DNA binding protein